MVIPFRGCPGVVRSLVFSVAADVDHGHFRHASQASGFAEGLPRLDDVGWETLRQQITDKQLAIVSLDLPTSHLALTSIASDDFTHSMLKAVNGMMLDMLVAITRKDYEDRRRRQMEGIQGLIVALVLTISGLSMRRN
jgi:hypothetical protein